VGELSGIWPQQQLIVSYGRCDAKRRINLWLRHLALRCVAPDGYPSTSLLIGRGKEGLEEISVGDPGQVPARLLEGFVELYRTGQRQPLRFFPRSSLAFAEKVFGLDPQDPAVVAAGLAAARKVWEATPRTDAAPIPGERDDPAVRKVLGKLDPFDGSDADPVGFARVALEVFEPLLSCLAGEGDE
jgi:exodeoxyribonuclease V gamma subunit